MSERFEVAAAAGVAFGVVLDKLFPKNWPLWQEAIAVLAVCAAIWAVLTVLGQSSEERARLKSGRRDSP